MSYDVVDSTSGYDAGMKVISLQSGSNGNCIYVEAGNVRLLFDAGISARLAERRLAERGRETSSVDALLISHDHRDHARSLGIFQRRFRVPVYVTPKTLAAAGARCDLGKLSDICHFRRGATLRFDDVRVETIPTPHDAVDGVGFVVDDGQRRLGILTDLGHVFSGLGAVARSLDAVLLESNFDPHMLAGGPYPEFLKRRIRGPGGHLSNLEAAELLGEVGGERLRWACLAHLSEHNNTPELALRAHREIVGAGITLHVASRYQASSVWEV
jgi:phosphoribosyl 1,2-cyclic phosphodiesterase